MAQLKPAAVHIAGPTVVLTVLGLGSLNAQASPPVTPTNSIEYFEAHLRAESLVRSGQLDAAISVFDSLVNLQPADGGVWIKLANALHANANCPRAIDAYGRAMNLGWVDAASGFYFQSVCQAQMGNLDEAARLLQRSLDAGYRFRARLANDRNLSSLQGHASFSRLTGRFDTPPPNRDAGWRRDLDYLVSEVLRTHYRFRREPLPASFVQMQQTLAREIGERTDEEMVVGLQRLLAQLGDGHTLVYPFGMNKGTLTRVPITMYWFSDGLFVVNADADLERWIGWEVTNIGGRDPAALWDRLSEVSSHDNPMGLRWVGPTYLTFPAFIRALGGTALGDTVAMQFRRGQELRQVQLVAGAVNPANIDFGLVPQKNGVAAPRYLGRLGENFWFEEIQEGIMYVQFNRVLNTDQESVDEFAIRLRDHLFENGTQNLVIDVRHNNGGEGSLLRELLRTLIAFDTVNKDSQLFVLLGRNTFSAAQTFISRVDASTDAVFVGEPSGSRPTRVGDESLFMLPYSGVLGAIASGFHQTESKDERMWIVPDLPILLRSVDYFAGRDPALDMVMDFVAR